MVRRASRFLAIALPILLLLSSAVGVTAYHEGDDATHPFADPRFEARWAYQDYPVEQLEVDRSWIWGPSPYTPGMMEPYADAPGGERLVQYFDKSRMELNNPDAPDDDLWAVTNGLLARDMMRGEIQVGDDEFIQHSEGPSNENVAGDPDATNSPTYATMGMLIDAEPRAEGTLINERLAADGSTSVDTGLDTYGVTAENRVMVDWIDHTIASVFWDFMTSTTTVWDGENFVEANLFRNPYYATGYPITEAYWATVPVDGVEQDVLLQCFERRCLTFTPGNPEGWQVEAGNVGQHYYRWVQTHQEGIPADSEVIAEGLAQPRGVTYTDDGVYVAEAGNGGDDPCVEHEELGEACLGMTSAITLVDDEGQQRVVDGLPSVGSPEEAFGVHDVVVGDDGTLYAVIGLAGSPEFRAEFGEAGELLGTLIQIDTEGDIEVLADLAQYEADENPDGDVVDSNPFSITMDGDDLIVTDAGGNSLLRVEMDGTISTIAVFPARDVEAPPFLEMPEGATIPMHAVPTGVKVGPDGNYYLTQLTGFPFPNGGANVYQVTPDGDVSTYAEGFTNAIDLGFDSQDRLYVLEIVAGGLLNVDEEAIGMGDFSSAASRIVRVEDGTQTNVMAEGLYVAAGLDVGADDELYVSNLTLTPDAQLVRIDVADGDGAMSFSADLSGDQEVPPVETDATGSASFQVNEDGTAIDYTVDVQNLDNILMAHIHLAPAGENGQVVAWLYPEMGPPPQLIEGTTSGELASGTITEDDLVGPLEGMSLDDLIDAMEAGNTYVNVHTEANQGGEIRGQISAD